MTSPKVYRRLNKPCLQHLKCLQNSYTEDRMFRLDMLVTSAYSHSCIENATAFTIAPSVGNSFDLFSKRAGDRFIGLV